MNTCRDKGTCIPNEEKLTTKQRGFFLPTHELAIFCIASFAYSTDSNFIEKKQVYHTQRNLITSDKKKTEEELGYLSSIHYTL